ncbi:FMN-binding negative transcriptional regulator [Salmonella enterica subsp. enterica]|nr:FMN-binding negative transcriptional regulator [Salmonella enterica subsp. enterica serovar Fischerstrasse]
MYIHHKMAMNDEGEAGRFIAAHPFGLLVSPSLAATQTHRHLFLHRRKMTRDHCANPQWKEMAGQRVLVVFSGSHAYISFFANCQICPYTCATYRPRPSPCPRSIATIASASFLLNPCVR